MDTVLKAGFQFSIQQRDAGRQERLTGLNIFKKAQKMVAASSSSSSSADLQQRLSVIGCHQAIHNTLQHRRRRGPKRWKVDKKWTRARIVSARL